MAYCNGRHRWRLTQPVNSHMTNSAADLIAASCLAKASTLRAESNRALAVAEETRNFDASTSNTWFVAYTLNREDIMAVAERRFRPEFKVAFDAWLATNPAKNPGAPPGAHVHAAVPPARPEPSC